MSVYAWCSTLPSGDTLTIPFGSSLRALNVAKALPEVTCKHLTHMTSGTNMMHASMADLIPRMEPPRAPTVCRLSRLVKPPPYAHHGLADAAYFPILPIPIPPATKPTIQIQVTRATGEGTHNPALP